MGLACLLATAVVWGCVDGTPVGLELRQEGLILLAPIMAVPGQASASDAPITRARLTARDAVTGVVYGTAMVELDPASDLWTLPLSLDLPAHVEVRVVVTIELLSVVNGSLVVQWSGLTAPLGVTPGGQPNEVHQVPLYRGPPDNLAVAGVELGPTPASVIEGEGFKVTAKVIGGGQNTTIYFSSLDPSIATVDAAGNVATLKRGTARIVAVAGPKADTGTVEVRALLLPDRALVATIEPGLDDAASRVTGGLRGDAAAATTLRGLLGSIRAALAGGFGLTAQQALQQARQTLSSYGGGGAAATADGPELSVVGLVLDHVERILRAAR